MLIFEGGENAVSDEENSFYPKIPKPPLVTRRPHKPYDTYIKRIKARDAQLKERVVELQFLCKDVKTFIQESCKLKEGACESEYADALIDLEREINELLALLLVEEEAKTT
jgi:hypothetical protein